MVYGQGGAIVVRRFFTLLKIEGKLVLRCIDSVFFGVIMPLGIALLIGMISGNKPAFDGASYSFLDANIPAIITVGICATAFMGIPLTIADYRDKKILKHYFVTLVYFPMLFLSGATIPFSMFPKSIQSFANFLPLTQGIKLLKGCALGLDTSLTIPLLVMIISTIITVALSIKLFKWE